MTEDQIQICKALGRVKYLPGSFDKRLGNSLYFMACDDLPRERELSEKQDEWMYRLLYKYRRQLPSTYEKFKEHKFCNKKI